MARLVRRSASAEASGGRAADIKAVTTLNSEEIAGSEELR